MTACPFDQLKRDPVFVLGAPRSGTTWVYDILTAHPQVAGIYESWLFTRKDGLLSLMTEAHWPPGHSGLGNLLRREELLGYLKNLVMEIASHAIKPQHRYLVEKSPSHVSAMPFIRELFPTARFIHVLRDGRDVSVSILAAADAWAPQWKKHFGRSVRTAAGFWKTVVGRARRNMAAMRGNCLEIRYEALSRAPHAAYRRLYDFCGIPYDEEILETVFQKTDFKRNYTGKNSGFRRHGQPGDWRRALGPADIAIFHAVAGRMLVSLGYEESRAWWLRSMLNRLL